MFLDLIHIFLNSHVTPTPNTFLKWSKISLEKFLFLNLSFGVLIELFLWKEKSV